jgi:hypothetical protein
VQVFGEIRGAAAKIQSPVAGRRTRKD